MGKKIKIAVMSDVHGNLQALRVALYKIEKLHCDYIYHLGDSIALGPFSRECLELLLQKDNIYMLMGNDEISFASGLSDSQSEYIKDEEFIHQMRFHSPASEVLRRKVSRLPYIIFKKYYYTVITFMHYPLDSNGKDFKPICKTSDTDCLDNLFKGIIGDVIFYGHQHPSSDIQGRARYVNPGPLDCGIDNIVRFSILNISQSAYSLEHLEVPY